MTATPDRDWYASDEDQPFRGMVPGALQRVQRRQAGVQQPYGPDWLKPTGPYDWNWEKNYLVKAYEILNALVRGDILKAMFFWPVRHGKTEAITIRFPIYWLQHFPRDHIIVGMHTQDKANDISRAARSIARGVLRIDPEREAVQQWGTIEGGAYKAVGVGAALPGYGGDLFAIDDPIASREDAESPLARDRAWAWWTNDLYSRRQTEFARFLFTMARWHEDDLAGRILNSTDGKNWTVLTMPALARENDPIGRAYDEPLDPTRMSQQALKDTQEVIGSYAFAGIYQQEPAPTEGGIFKRVWWQFWEPRDQFLGPVRVKDAEGGSVERFPVKLPLAFDEMAQSWDMSFKSTAHSDPVAGQVWGRKAAQAFLLDRDFGRKDFPKTIAALKRMTLKWPQTGRKWIEDTANGPAIISQLRGQVPGLIGVQPDGGDKVARAHAVTWLVEAGNVYLPHPSIAPWVWTFIEDFAGFNKVANDHDVDALTQALRKFFPQGIVDDVDYLPARIHA